MPNTKHITVDQASTLMTGFATKADARFLKQADVTQYTIKKQAEAESGYAHTYQLFTVGTGTGGADEAVGAKINIPKDMVVSAAELKTVETADVPYSGAKVGDKYIDMTIANSSGTHVYIPVNDLVDTYTAGNGIDITSNAVAIKIDSTNANGLSTSSAGLALATATTTTAGAMSASDKSKLDNADVTAYSAGNGIDITSHAVSAVVDSTNANGLSVGASGLAMATAGSGTTGALSSTDWSTFNGKQNALTEGTGIDITGDTISVNGDITAYTAGNGVDITSHAVSAVVDSSNANGLSVGASGIALSAATQSAAGAMSAADKTKLDGLQTATDQEVAAILDDIWPTA